MIATWETWWECWRTEWSRWCDGSEILSLRATDPIHWLCLRWCVKQKRDSGENDGDKISHGICRVRHGRRAAHNTSRMEWDVSKSDAWRTQPFLFSRQTKESLGNFGQGNSCPMRSWQLSRLRYHTSWCAGINCAHPTSHNSYRIYGDWGSGQLLNKSVRKQINRVPRQVFFPDCHTEPVNHSGWYLRCGGASAIRAAELAWRSLVHAVSDPRVVSAGKVMDGRRSWRLGWGDVGLDGECSWRTIINAARCWLFSSHDFMCRIWQSFLVDRVLISFSAQVKVSHLLVWAFDAETAHCELQLGQGEFGVWYMDFFLSRIPCSV